MNDTAIQRLVSNDATRRECLGSFHSFVKLAWAQVDPRTFVDAWHIYVMCEYLQRFAHTVMYDGSNVLRPLPPIPAVKNLIINIPPGHAKSLVASVLFPAWVWLHYPSAKFLCESHSSNLTTRDSVRCRDLIRSQWYQEIFHPTWVMKRDQDEKSYYVNSAFGWRVSVGVESEATGWRPNFRITDDPMDASGVTSERKRNAVIEWNDGKMSSRLQDLTRGHLIIMQRLHENDLVGHLLKTRGKNYAHLCLQAEYDPESLREGCNSIFDDPRQHGELLFPEVYPSESVSFLKTALGSFGTSAQLQQAPTPRGGGFFKNEWFPRYSYSQISPSDFTECIQSWDCAVKDKPDNDRAAGQVWAKIRSDHPLYPNRICLYDAVALQLDFVDNVKAIRTMSEKHPYARRKLIEDKANGSPIIQLLTRQFNDGSVIPFEPGSRSKEVRAEAVTPACEAGLVIIPSEGEASWVSDWLDEITKFNKHKRDDQVDAFTQAVLHFTQTKEWVFSL